MADARFDGADRAHQQGRHGQRAARGAERPFPLAPEIYFAHRLALALGKTVGEIARDMSVHEFVDWQRFAAVHPFPADLADIHGAQALALLANINRDAKKTPPFAVTDFLVIRRVDPADKPPPASEAERMRDALMGMD